MYRATLATVYERKCVISFSRTTNSEKKPRKILSEKIVIQMIYNQLATRSGFVQVIVFNRTYQEEKFYIRYMVFIKLYGSAHSKLVKFPVGIYFLQLLKQLSSFDAMIAQW